MAFKTLRGKGILSEISLVRKGKNYGDHHRSGTETDHTAYKKYDLIQNVLPDMLQESFWFPLIYEQNDCRKQFE